MTIVQSPLVGTPGASVTASNHGGDAFTSVAGGLVFDASGSGVVSNATGGALILTASTDRLLVRKYFRFSSLPGGADVRLQGGYYSGGGTTYGFLGILNSLVRARQQVIGVSNAGTDPGAALLPDTDYRVENLGVASTNSANGTARMAIYLGDSTTPIWDSGDYTGNTAAATGLFASGRILCTTTTEKIWNVGVKTGTDATWGAWPAAASVTYSAGADATVDPWEPVTLTGSSTPAGNVSAWTQVSGPAVTLGGSGATRTYTAPADLAGATLVFDYGGDTVTHTVRPATDAVKLGGVLVPFRARWGFDVP